MESIRGGGGGGGFGTNIIPCHGFLY